MVLLLVAGTQETLLVEGLFVARQGFIAEHLCENRDRPHLECNGKCFLAKRVEAVHHDHQSDPEAPSLRQARPPLVIAMVVPHAAVPQATASSHAFPTATAPPVLSRVAHDIFRPPWSG